MFIFAKVNPKIFFCWGSTSWDQVIKIHYSTGALHVLHSFLDFCSAFFPKTSLDAKYIVLSFLGNTSEVQGEILITA